jgi:hyperosmotically inducible periplasmic protein
MRIWRKSAFWVKRVIPLSLLSAGLLLASGCGDKDGEKTTTTSPEALPLTDSDLASNIKAKINSDEALRNANLDVDAHANENRATISGTVSSEALRTRAIDLAHSAKPGMILDAKIDVKPPDVARKEWTEEYSHDAAKRAKDSGDSVSDTLDDTWIHTKIVGKLIGSSKVPERKINVDVDKKVVTLRGTVSTQAEKTEAAKIAQETEGVVRVVNQLKVGPS